MSGDAVRDGSTPLRSRIIAGTVVDENGCWIWQRYKNADGYGHMSVGRSTARAHRVAYEEWIGPIPEGLTIDHLCRVRACCNPTHLEPVTNRVNVLRGDTLPAALAGRTHCKNGHELTPENVYLHHATPDAVNRMCRTCKRAAAARWARRSGRTTA